MTTIGPHTPVQELMTRAVARIAPDARLREVAQKLVAVEAGALAVGTTEAVTGIVSERDITRAFARHDHPSEVRAIDVASDGIIWCEPTTTAADAAHAMSERGVRHLLVGGADGDVAGIVSARDLLDALVAAL